ncbi:hypothetical protein AEAC466_05225 [Asticcacaulis sp. AC466]|uniref:alpha/beta hydrolase n=1 Tax=Asticcacaulis sp. AC466 TaxID=1282362 RepID=UPI0003C400E5|nr:alpha/beta hydrolase [Asticcacaulis sp. AC466]ESQ85113.1 hypothetical protein AEAC466_05225 [Asticcacaulis sp. AC466]
MISRFALFGLIVLPAGLVLAIVVSVIAVVGISFLVNAPAVFLFAGLVAFALTVWGSAGLGLRWLTGNPRPLGSLAFSAVASMGLVAISIPVLQPFPVQPERPIPADVAYWDIGNTERLAYVHAPSRVVGAHHRPVVVLHGGPGTPNEGLPDLTNALNALGYDVYSYDQIGAGRSTRLADVTRYTVARNVEDLEKVRLAIGADRMVLLGTSWGATLAAHYTLAHPDHVAKVVFASPGPLWPPARAGDGASPFESLTGAAGQRYRELTEAPRVVAQALLAAANPNAAHRLVGDAEADSWMHEVAVAGVSVGACPGTKVESHIHHNLQGFYTNLMTNRDLKRVPDPRPGLRAIKVPVLVVRGACDFIAPAYANDYAETFGTAVHTISGVGHAIDVGKSTEFDSLVLGLLR